MRRLFSILGTILLTAFFLRVRKAPGEKAAAPEGAFVVSKLTKLGSFPFSIQAGGGYCAAKPDVGPDWRMQLAFILLLPAAR